MTKIRKTLEAFTFIETIIVLSIMVILSAGIGIPASKYIERARTISARTQIETYRLAISAYELDCGFYPSECQGLASLWEKPVLEPVPERWNGPYLSRRPSRDPWGTEYRYVAPGPNGLPYGITSFGADGEEGGKGIDADLISWD